MKTPNQLFERCARWLLEEGRDEWIIVHGFRLGIEQEDCFPHCWLEHPERGVALDLTTQPRIMDERNYRLRGDLYTVNQFNADQLERMIKQHKTYGPFNRNLKCVPPRILH